jgi:hypothetical protein
MAKRVRVTTTVVDDEKPKKRRNGNIFHEFGDFVDEFTDVLQKIAMIIGFLAVIFFIAYLLENNPG